MYSLAMTFAMMEGTLEKNLSSLNKKSFDAEDYFDSHELIQFFVVQSFEKKKATNIFGDIFKKATEKVVEKRFRDMKAFADAITDKAKGLEEFDRILI